MFDRFPFEHGPRHGRHGCEDGPQHGRLFGRGEFKYLILELLKQKPSYGYEIIKAIEERFQGAYAPSPGVVYPTLQMLEEMGYVTAAESEGRKVYSITEAGLAFLEEQRQTSEDIGERMGQWFGRSSGKEWREAMHDLRHSVGRMQKLIEHEVRTADAGRVARVRQVLANAYHEIEVILTEPTNPEE
ncbi:MAG: PadR family transcriptional regulator [Anaerolineae bacterium]